MEPKQKRFRDSLLSASLAVILTGLIFLLLPLSRALSPDVNDDLWVVRPIEMVRIPPPPPPEIEIRSANTPDAPSSPDIRPPTERIQLETLPIRLSAQPDTSLLRTLPVAELGKGIDLGEAIRKFTFADLKGGPRVLSVPPVSIPARLARRGFVRGRVVFSIQILEDGSVRVLDVVESSHPELIESARSSAARARFEAPEVDGQNVSVEGNWPLLIESSR